MVFYVRTKFKNIFRCIYFSEEDLKKIGEKKQLFVNMFIAKGKVYKYNIHIVFSNELQMDESEAINQQIKNIWIFR